MRRSGVAISIFSLCFTHVMQVHAQTQASETQASETQAPATTADLTPPPAGASPYYTLIADGVSSGDASLITDAVDAGIERMLAYFGTPAARPGLERLLRDIDATVIIHPEPTDLAGPGTATTRSGTRDGSVETYYAEIHLLAPSAHPPGLRTSSNEPKDDVYFQRLAVHEYSTVFLEIVSRAKTGGWRLRQAPAWFVQGYQEYFGLTRAGPGPLARSLPRYIEIVQSEPDRVTNDFGFDVRGPYVTGAVLVHFMHEHFGDDRVLALLRSAEPTFGRAVRAELGVDTDEFMEAWTTWLRSQAPAHQADQTPAK